MSSTLFMNEAPGEPEGQRMLIWWAPSGELIPDLSSRDKLSTMTIVRGGTFQYPQRKLRFSRLSSDFHNGNWEIESSGQKTRGYFSLLSLQHFESKILSSQFPSIPAAWPKPLAVSAAVVIDTASSPTSTSPEARSGYLLLVWILSLFLIWLPA